MSKDKMSAVCKLWTIVVGASREQNGLRNGKE